MAISFTLGVFFFAGSALEAKAARSEIAESARTGGAKSCAESATELSRWVRNTVSAVLHEPDPAVRHLTVAGTRRLDKGSCLSLSLVHDDPADRLVINGLTVPGGNFAAFKPFNGRVMAELSWRRRTCLFLSIDEKVRWKSVVNIARQLDIIVKRIRRTERQQARWERKHPELTRRLARLAQQSADELAEKYKLPPANSRTRAGQSRPSKFVVDIALAFNAHDPVRAPAASAMERKLRRLGIIRSSGRLVVDHSAVADNVQDLWHDPLLGTCRPEQAFLDGSLGRALFAADYARLGEILADGLSRQVRACDCKLDLPSLKTLVYYAHSPLQAFDAVWFRANRRGMRVKLPADTPWSVAHKAVLSALKKYTTLALQD